jgi:nucleoside-diphosphate-sugar epimerase
LIESGEHRPYARCYYWSSGRIGIQVTEGLSGAHVLILVDRLSVPGKRSVLADLAVNPNSERTWLSFRRKPWSYFFEGADVLVHLAGDVRYDAPWDCVLRDNSQVTWNVIEAAVKHRVPRVVFASSNWASDL